MVTYLKKGAPVGREVDDAISARVRDMIRTIAQDGEAAVRGFSANLDKWNPPSFRLTPSDITRACDKVEPAVRGAIENAAHRIQLFAEAQKQSLKDFEVEIEPGIVLGQRNIPVDSVGTYIPGGRYHLVSSALMSILTARVAGVRRIVSCSPPDPEFGIFPPTLFAMKVAGVDEIYALGGVQAVAAMALGSLMELSPVNMVVGAGNTYVAEAKRQLFGQIGIDLLAGPTEIVVLADSSARPHVVAVDLLSQAEHGPTSPVSLVTTSLALGRQVLQAVADILPTWPTKEVSARAWADYGSIVVADSAEEAVNVVNRFAPEHLELQVNDPDWYESRLTNYGSLFIGEDSTVTFGDKAVGTNHTLPTNRAAYYTGGLWVGKFLKTVTYSHLSSDASKRVAADSSIISRAEGMLGHAAASDLRMNLHAYPVSEH